MLQMVPLPVQLRLSAPGPKYSTMAPVPPFTVRMPATFRITSLALVQPLIFPVSFTPMSLGNLSSQGSPLITSQASAPPTPMATMPRPPAFTVWLSVPIIMAPGKAYCSSTTWWMMPAPGFQKPMPYLLLTLSRKLKTSLLLFSASCRSWAAPTRAWIRWSQCTVLGTATCLRPVVMNWSRAIWAVASCMATRSGANST